MKLRWPTWARKSGQDTWTVFRDFFAARGAVKSGVEVNRTKAMQVTTVLACARLIADGIAQVPLKLFQESPDGLTRLPAKQHPLFDVLHRRPNGWQTSYEFRETVGLHLVLCGNHYSFKVMRRGQVVELWPFEPQHVRPVLAADGNTLTYRVSFANGQTREIPASAIWHVRGPSWCGWMGMDAVYLAREAIGLAIATEAQHAQMHANGVSIPGVYSVDGTLSHQQYEALREFISNNYTGSKRGLPMIVDRNAKFTPTAQTGVDGQHLETRRFQVQEICRAMRVIPLMVGLDDKSTTYASAEQMFLAHVVHTLMPWYERLEQSIDVQLLTDEDRAQGIYAKFVAQGLLRGSMKDRADYFAKALGSGGSPAWMSQDEVRGLEELNPMGGAAAVLPVPSNKPKQPPAEPEPAT